MGRYVGKAERENILVIDTLTGRMESSADSFSKMGKLPAKYFRMALSLLKKAMIEYAKDVSVDDYKRIVHEAGQMQVVLTSRAYQRRGQLDNEQIEIVWTLADYAIGKNCTGCTKDGESCPLKHALAGADVPYTTLEPNNCPYEHPGGDET